MYSGENYCIRYRLLRIYWVFKGKLFTKKFSKKNIAKTVSSKRRSKSEKKLNVHEWVMFCWQNDVKYRDSMVHYILSYNGMWVCPFERIVVLLCARLVGSMKPIKLTRNTHNNNMCDEEEKKYRNKRYGWVWILFPCFFSCVFCTPS